MEKSNGEARFYRPWGNGLSNGRASRQGRSRHHGLQPHGGESAGLGRPARRRFARTPAEAAAGAEIVFTCVGNDDDVRSVVLGEKGALAGMSKNAILVDHTTASAELARELDAAAKGRSRLPRCAGVRRPGRRESGKLTVMVGGDAGASRAPRR